MPLHLLQGSFTAGELSPALTGRVDMAAYGQGCRTLKNMLVQPHGGAVKRPGFMLVDELPGEAVLIPFVFNAEQSYCLVFGQKWLRIVCHGGFILNEAGDAPYQVTSPYTLAQAKQLSFAQSADVLFLAHRDVRPQRLMRQAHADWIFEPMTFASPIAAPTGVTVTFTNDAKKDDGSSQVAQCTTPYTYGVTAIDASNKESVVSAGASITGPASNNWRAGDYITVAWNAVPGAVEYRVYKKEFSGRWGFAATAGNASKPSFIDYNVRPVLTDGPPAWTNPFPGSDFPGVVCLFEQRLVFASTRKRPQTFWLSRSADYDNFSASSPIKGDDSVEMTVASSDVSSVCWMVALRSLVVGTAGMEWELASSEGALTAKTVRFTPQSYRGSAAVRALVIGNMVLHLTRSGREVRDLKYDFGADSYGGTDRTILAEHLLRDNRIINWTYQPAPNGIIWAVRDDGLLLGLTFQAEHEVCAWHRHQTDGWFKAVCSLPAGADDELYAVIKRNNKFMLEMMAARPKSSDQGGLDPSRAVYLDSSLLYEGAPTKTLTGLAHLEGRKVSVLADGGVQCPRLVKNGAIELDAPASVAVVGLPYEADLETMPCEIQGQEGTSVPRKKYINAVNVFFRDTVAAKIGPSFDRLEEVPWRTYEPYGQGLKPKTETVRMVLPTMARNSASVCVRSDAPLPVTVLAVAPEIEVK